MENSDVSDVIIELVIEPMTNDENNTNDDREQAKPKQFSDIYRKPFHFGWKREVVYPYGTIDESTTSKAEVYYITPCGKKLRTKSQIAQYLEDGLTVNMFSFATQPLGTGDDSEIVRKDTIKGYRNLFEPMNTESNQNLINDCPSQFPILNTRSKFDKNQSQGQSTETNSQMDLVTQLKQKLAEKDDLIEDLTECLKRNEAEITRLQAKTTKQICVQDEIAKLLPMLTRNQIALMTGKKKRVNWTCDEISTGFTLSFFSRRGYTYTIKDLQYALPSIRTLQEWAENMSVKPGILKDSLLVLKALTSTLTEGEKQVIVSFDEMKCKEVYEYNKTLDSIMGPYHQMQVVMVRGLFKTFKQPVYVNFDTKMTPNLLDLLATELHECGLNVVGFVGDNGGGNVGLWGNCGVSFNHNTIKHPKTGEDIYMFSDAPHLLKLLRNWFIDGGFVLPDGTVLKVDKVRELLEINPEISPIYKVSLKHIELEGPERQNVAMASQLFSHSVAECLKRSFPGDKEVEKLANFIELVNKWFDISNSYSLNGICFKAPYGVNLDEQNKVLDEMYSTVSTMKCLNKNLELKNSLQIFQKGILMSIKSMKSLRNKMEENFGYKYILTHRLNQDCLENFFSQVRGKNGPNDHPSPVECLNIIKSILLGKSPGISTQLHTNTIAREHEEYATSSLMNILLEENSRKISENIENAENILASDDYDQITNAFIEDLSHEMTVDEVSKRIDRAKDDGIEYIAGWFAYKFKTQHPEYSKSRRENLPTYMTDHTYAQRSQASNSWIDRISYGGLSKPSEQVLQWVTRLESQFNILQGDKFNYRENVKKELIDILKLRCRDIPSEVISMYAKLRIFLRCKFLNKERVEAAILKKIENRKAKKRSFDVTDDDLSRSKKKKMKKIVS